MWKSKLSWPGPLAGVVWSLLLLLTGCDDRCSERNCRSMMKICGFSLKTEPNYALCGSTPTVETRAEDFCPQACAASGAGEVLECFWDNDLDCDESERVRQSIGDTCGGKLGSGDATCMMTCATERTTCEQRCTPDGGTEPKNCMDCAKRCGWAQGRCETACREKS